MKFPRSSGILLHPTSLPGPHGIGDFGPESYRFAEYLCASGMGIWQVLPLNPTGYGESPYQAFSAFAGNPYLISLDRLADDGWLLRHLLANLPLFPGHRVDFSSVMPFKKNLLHLAAEHFFTSASADCRHEFETFVREQQLWLEDFALFMAAKDAHDGVVWTDWEEGLRAREPQALLHWREKLSHQVLIQKFLQFQFFRQWAALKKFCNKRHIRMMGDIPIYVAHDSSDVWSHPELFNLDDHGRPTKIAGVPPDYFSATGQLWGNPTYRWDHFRDTGYRWWTERFNAALTMFDMVRIDHFRGFEAYWEVPGGEMTAENGTWVKGPGADLFSKLTDALGDLPIVAENLGVITPEVESIRLQFGYPGMAILQFAFSTDPQAPTFRPHNYVRELVAYTGTHDNDTMYGWWRSGVEYSTRSRADLEKEIQDALNYFGANREQFDREVNWVYIRQLMMSVADTALFPMQDVLGLGSESRMNVPATTGSNWLWRMPADGLREADQRRLKDFAEIYDRTFPATK
jgi:4-alpha-glucanotransferase